MEETIIEISVKASPLLFSSTGLLGVTWPNVSYIIISVWTLLLVADKLTRIGINILKKIRGEDERK